MRLSLTLTLSKRRSLAYRNQLLCISMDWLLQDKDLRHERVKDTSANIYSQYIPLFKKLI